ncbi:hypothetical protein E2C01_076079 [Portunus trituberculatus]|uniref:Uncharacterized protein n=1 Tax=Portunus trituberculatus TaxID=210409 RepID=A0A5B7ICB0_PORTR|nr:hypothetical protein [Portunus trituberculatus]
MSFVSQPKIFPQRSSPPPTPSLQHSFLSPTLKHDTSRTLFLPQPVLLHSSPSLPGITYTFLHLPSLPSTLTYTLSDSPFPLVP